MCRASGSASTVMAMSECLAEQAGREVGGDLAEVGVAADGLGRLRAGDEVVELGHGGDTALDRLQGAGIAPGLAGLVRHEAHDHREAVLDPVVDFLLGLLLVTLALHPVGDVLEGEQQPHGVVAGTEHLARVQAHHAMSDAREGRLDQEVLHHGVGRDHFVQEFAQAGNVPLLVAEIVDEPAKGLGLLDPEGLVEGLVGERDPQVRVEDQNGGPDRFHDVERAKSVQDASHTLSRRINGSRLALRPN